MTRGRIFLTSASKFNIESNGGIFDVRPKNDRASLDVETPSGVDAESLPQGTGLLARNLLLFSDSTTSHSESVDKPLSQIRA